MENSNKLLNDLVNQLNDFTDKIEVLYSKLLKERELKRSLVPIKSTTNSKNVYKNTHKQ